MENIYNFLLLSFIKPSFYTLIFFREFENFCTSTSTDELEKKFVIPSTRWSTLTKKLEIQKSTFENRKNGLTIIEFS